MKKRRIGSLDVTLVGLGCNNFGRWLDYERTLSVVDAALDAGVNFFDTADRYGDTRSEEFLGRALSGRRHRVVLATKFGMPLDGNRRGAQPSYVCRAIDESLRRLRTDYVDLYQLHQPDPVTPIEETLGALDDLVRIGKAREIGCSNFSRAQLRNARLAAGQGARFVSIQNEYSLLHREPEHGVLAECARQGLAFLPFFPLASGLLTGKYRRGHPAPLSSRLARPGTYQRFLNDRNLQTVEALTAFAESRGHTLLELAISWLAARSEVSSVICGASSGEQVRANAAAVTWELSAADFDEVDRIAPLPRRGLIRRLVGFLAPSRAGG